MKKLIIISFLLLTISLIADTNFRVMSYNALNFDGTDRLSDFETVLTAAAPDILICQEIESASASDAILTILNSVIGGYERADFVSDVGTLHNMLYYKTSIAAWVSQDEINTSPRDVSEYVLNIDGNPIRFYSCHLKASTGYEAERLAAVTILRDHLNALSAGTEFVIVGDMNFYTSSEDGYEKFVADEAIDIGRSEDLCTQVGNWHNNSYYSNVHSQSTRLGSVGSGSTGGMDDKFDFIFGNYGINDGSGIEYSTGSFTSYGNDGSHFDQSINDGTNSAVSASVADALYNASDHLPVFADFVSIGGGPATPLITVTPSSLTGFNYIVDNGPSVEQSFLASGSNLTANISITATTNYEISETSGSGYTSSITLTQSGGSVSETTIYVRLKADLSSGNYNSEDIATSSTGATNMIVTCSGTVTTGETPDVFFSEYIEGSSNNKALEIYNNSGSSISLDDFRINQSVNGGGWLYQHTFPAGATLSDGDVWVIITDTVILPLFDPTNADEILAYPSVVHHNGDDARGLEYTDDGGTNWLSLDVIGIPTEDPGDGWEVAGEAVATQNNTLVRKTTVITGNTDWASSAGTTASNSEWIVYPEDTFDNLGLHTMGGNALPLISNIEQNPTSDILSTTTVSISANVTDSDGTVSLVELHWGLSSGVLGTTITMSNGGVGDIYTTITNIPAQALGTTVYYEVYAEDNAPENSVSLEYDFTVVEVSSGILPYAEPFNVDLSDCYTNNVSGATKEWYWHSGGYAAMNGYNSGDTEEDWLILPAIDFENYSNEVMSFDSWYNYGSDDSTNYLKLLYSYDYPGLGDPTYSSWTELTFIHPVSSSTWSTSGNIDLSTLTDTITYIALKYHYEVGDYRWWEIDNISITGTGILSAPTNVVITHDGTNVTISWDEVVLADHYYVYSSDEPYSEYDLETTLSSSNTSWTTSITDSKKFYYITAE